MQPFRTNKQPTQLSLCLLPSIPPSPSPPAKVYSSPSSCCLPAPPTASSQPASSGNNLAVSSAFVLDREKRSESESVRSVRACEWKSVREGEWAR